MGLFSRKSQLERLLDTIDDAVDVLNVNARSLSGGNRAKPLKTGLIAAGGLAGLTAASAGISSLRRRAQGGGQDS